ncbi:MAG: hypothetical protein ACE14V_01945 [bacterium]
MLCPNCKQALCLTWKRYLKVSFDNLVCPHCQIRLMGRYRWIYYPLFLLFIVITSYVSARFNGIVQDPFTRFICWSIVSLLVGILLDKYLGTKLLILKIDLDDSRDKPGVNLKKHLESEPYIL